MKELNYKQVMYIPLAKWDSITELLPDNYTVHNAKGYWHSKPEAIVVITQFGSDPKELDDVYLNIVRALLASGEEAVLVEATMTNAAILDNNQ